jgi:hypothetical protein
MPGSAPRFGNAYTIVVAPRTVAGATLRRRTRGESHGVLVAVACVVAAILLYLAATIVYGFDEDDEGFSLGAVRGADATLG